MLISSFFLGMLHALEPGHGKGAMAAIAFSRQLKIKSILIFSFFNFLTHTFFAGAIATAFAVIFQHSKTAEDYLSSLSHTLSWLIIMSGIVLLAYAIRSKSKNLAKNCCDDNYLIVQKQINNPKKLFLLAFSIGLIPCPTAIISLIAGINSGYIYGAILSVIIFGIGVSTSLLILLIVVNKTAKKLQLIKGQMQIANYYLHIQAVFILLIGLINLKGH